MKYHVRLKHPKHGEMDCYHPDQAEEAKKNGWTEKKVEKKKSK